VGNKDEFDMQLEDLGMGPVTEIDITIPSGEESTELEITPEKLAMGKEIIMAAVNAHGGLDDFKSINTVTRKGTFTISTPQGEFPLAVNSWDEFPDKSKSVAMMFGNEMLDIRNGETGWKTNQMGQVVEKTPQEIAKDKKDLMRTLLYVFMTADEPKYQPVYTGSEEFEGRQVEIVTLLDSDGEKLAEFGFYKDNNMLAFKSYWGETPTGEGNITETYSDFTEVNNITVPMKSVRSMDGQKVMAVDLTEYKINADIPAGTFSKPE
jgi:hypothetical protein